MNVLEKNKKKKEEKPRNNSCVEFHGQGLKM